MSTLETFVLPTLILPFSRVTFVVKQSLVEYPVFRHIMRSREPVTVGRANPRDDLKAVLAEGPERLGRGLSVVVFPQTTRSLVFDAAKFNSIGVKLAKRAGVPVMPVAIRSDAWGNGRLVRDLGAVDPSKPVHIAFGAPFAVEGRGGEEHERVVAFIGGHMRRWGVPVEGE
jgi:1-acyl-sn-glycerol-3-phosphate acyltransferase